jgi:hypothetical protein
MDFDEARSRRWWAVCAAGAGRRPGTKQLRRLCQALDHRRGSSLSARPEGGFTLPATLSPTDGLGSGFDLVVVAPTGLL